MPDREASAGTAFTVVASRSSHVPGLDRRSRLAPGGLALLTLVCGVASRTLIAPGPVSKYLGVALWAALLYALIVFVRPALAPGRAAIIGVAISWSVELFQLTPIPRALGAIHLIFAWILGATFGAADLVAYVVGIAVAAGVHVAARRAAGASIRAQAGRR